MVLEFLIEEVFTKRWYKVRTFDHVKRCRWLKLWQHNGLAAKDELFAASL